jgi:ERF superfamily.
MKNILAKLLLIQQELKAPKNQYNSFGKYKYRSQEDILEAVKPLCGKHDCVLTIEDNVELINEDFYIVSTAKIYDVPSGELLEVKANAREPRSKKGMDDSQITGAASSYARKYALNGLFCIDDTEDADGDAPKEYIKRRDICTACGKEVKAIKKNSGEIVEAEKVYKTCGNRCYECYTKSTSKVTSA